MTQWQILDQATRVLRSEYGDDNGRSTCLAVGLGPDELMLISPPAGVAANDIYDNLSTHGTVTAIVAPNPYHNLGLPKAQKRYPEATLYAHPIAAKRIQGRYKSLKQIHPLQDLQAQLPEHTELFPAPHMQRPDTVVRIHTSQGTIWYITDVITNIAHTPKNAMLRALLWLLRFRRGPAINRFGCRFVMRASQPAFARWLSDELQQHPPALFVPGHGPVLQDSEFLQHMHEWVRREFKVG